MNTRSLSTQGSERRSDQSCAVTAAGDTTAIPESDSRPRRPRDSFHANGLSFVTHTTRGWRWPYRATRGIITTAAPTRSTASALTTAPPKIVSRSSPPYLMRSIPGERWADDRDTANFSAAGSHAIDVIVL